VALKDNCMVSGLAQTFVLLVALTNKIIIQTNKAVAIPSVCLSQNNISKQH